jgi:hypothetical protein
LALTPWFPGFVIAAFPQVAQLDWDIPLIGPSKIPDTNKMGMIFFKIYYFIRLTLPL